VAIAVAAPDEFPARMEIRIVEEHRSERGSMVVRIGEGICPWCGWGAMRAEAGGRGYCPSCGGWVLAVLVEQREEVSGG
jgi:hypothetical protein